jgi:hypothetical protein
MGVALGLAVRAQAVDGGGTPGAGSADNATVIGAVGAAIIGIFVLTLRAFGVDLRPAPPVTVKTTNLASKSDAARIERKVTAVLDKTEDHVAVADIAIEDIHVAHRRIQEALERIEPLVQEIARNQETILMIYSKASHRKNGSDNSTD